MQDFDQQTEQTQLQMHCPLHGPYQHPTLAPWDLVVLVFAWQIR